MTKDEAMRMALDALLSTGLQWPDIMKAIEALRTALAQPDEQIGITYEEANPPQPYCNRCGKKLGTEVTDIHTCTPMRKEWVGLTGEELQAIYQETGTVHFKFTMVEAKLKEKND